MPLAAGVEPPPYGVPPDQDQYINLIFTCRRQTSPWQGARLVISPPLFQNVDNFAFPEKSDTENRDKSPHFEDINTDFECNQTDFKCNQTDFECKNTDFECLYKKV